MLQLFFVILLFCTFAISNYTPIKTTCPSNLIRSSKSQLNDKEVSFINSRSKSHVSNFLKRAKISTNYTPNIGLSFSGGGYRSSLVSAGIVEALDERSDSILSGLLQSSNYIAGLSGGAWFLTSFVSYQYESITTLKNKWHIKSLIDYYGDDIIEQAKLWIDVDKEIQGKKDAGFTISITDLYGRLLSYVLLPNNGLNNTWSNENNLNPEFPFPILVADGRAPNSIIINSNSTVFEFTPFEFGSYDIGKFIDIKYLGSESGTCFTNFDNNGFLMGTSSSLFNEVMLKIGTSELPSFLKDLINNILVNPFEKLNIDVATYPNPFYKEGSDSISSSSELYLVDGGEDGENLPIEPLMKRNLDILFTFDNSNDWLNWPDGSSLIKTYERQFTHPEYLFPYVPDTNTFKYFNLSSKPTFFGCDAKNLTSLTSDIYSVPLVVYFGNRPFSYWTNTSTYKLKYTDSERDGMILNGYNIATRLNGTLDKEFNTCIGCAMIRRNQERNGEKQSDQCKKCFEKYCWNGEIYKQGKIGENFNNEGIITNTNDYNSESIPGFNSGGPDI
ncbi:unnamed protein product [Candida verbasci]|uniref:Lysophospholipase n=1 Tax=Candida verbasci TaxID=1227364 RepID=A0A9W4U237_9ASCO|nr:unnamed protein product [Candida verbasci]